MSYGNAGSIPMVLYLAFALAIFYLWTLNRRNARIKRFVQARLLQSITPSVSVKRKVVKMAGVTLAVFLGLLALARPQWGFVWEESKRMGLDILIAMDVSKSMLATDVKPNRIERSKFAVKDLIKRLSGDRIGLIAFAGTSFLQCPLTIDYNGFALALDDISVGTIPRGGTAIASAIDEATSVFNGQEKKYKVLVIITDGEELEGDALAAARAASGMGIKIYCVGVGTSEGELIPAAGERGEKVYLADRKGNVVKTRLNEDILKQVAISTGGSYVRATQSELGLTLLYDKSISRLEKRDIDAKMRKHYHERFQYFVALAAFLLFLEPLIPERKRIAA